MRVVNEIAAMNGALYTRLLAGAAAENRPDAYKTWVENLPRTALVGPVARILQGAIRQAQQEHLPSVEVRLVDLIHAAGWDPQSQEDRDTMLGLVKAHHVQAREGVSPPVLFVTPQTGLVHFSARPATGLEEGSDPGKRDYGRISKVLEKVVAEVVKERVRKEPQLKTVPFRVQDLLDRRDRFQVLGMGGIEPQAVRVFLYRRVQTKQPIAGGVIRSGFAEGRGRGLYFWVPESLAEARPGKIWASSLLPQKRSRGFARALEISVASLVEKRLAENRGPGRARVARAVFHPADLAEVKGNILRESGFTTPSTDAIRVYLHRWIRQERMIVGGVIKGFGSAEGTQRPGEYVWVSRIAPRSARSLATKELEKAASEWVVLLATRGEKTSVRVAVGPSAFRVPGLREAVTLLSQSGFGRRILVLPEGSLPKPELYKRLVDLAGQSFSVANLSFRGYADPNDTVMGTFREMVRPAHVPFLWRRPASLNVLVRRLLMDLGVPKQSVTQETVDRLLSLIKLEQAV